MKEREIYEEELKDILGLLRDEGRLDSLIEKSRIIKELGEVFHKEYQKVGSMTGCRLAVFVNPARRAVKEYLVVNYHTAYTVRNVSINSSGANLRELAKLADGGYYEELDDYKRYLESPEWVELDLSEGEDRARGWAAAEMP